MPQWVQAALWGLLAGGALLVGAAAGFMMRIPARAIAATMAFGSGVLISALSFELMEKAFERGGIHATSLGFLTGVAAYTAANWLLCRQGAKHRKRSGSLQPSEAQNSGSGLAIAIGALLDSVPESIFIGLSLLQDGGVNVVAVTAVFLSNLPEGLSSAAGMKNAGRSAAYVFGVWGGISLAASLSSVAGNVLFEGASPGTIAATTAVAAGAILAMLVDTMIPEAFATAHNFAGLITAAGFLVAFWVSKLGG